MTELHYAVWIFEGKTYSHQPLVTMTEGNKIVEFEEENDTIRYHCQTRAGMSGGAVHFDDKIVGKLAARNFEQNQQKLCKDQSSDMQISNI